MAQPPIANDPSPRQAATSGPQGSLSTELREVIAAWAQSQRRLVVLAAAFADSEEWVLAGAPTAAHWLADAADVEVCTAREWIRIGRRLAELPAAAAAFAAGRLSYSKVRILTRVADADNEEALVDLAEHVPAGALGRSIASWIARHTDPEELAARQHRARSVRWRTGPDGMVTFTMRLPPRLAGLLIALLTALTVRTRAATRGIGDASADAFPSLAQQHADALEVLLTDGSGTVDTEIVLHVRGNGSTLDDGTPIPDTVVERIAPRSFLRVLIHDADGHPINASHRRRHPDARQRRVVKERDQVCVDCGSPILLQYDHNPPFDQSRHTVVDELELRCAPCHRKRHRAA